MVKRESASQEIQLGRYLISTYHTYRMKRILGPSHYTKTIENETHQFQLLLQAFAVEKPWGYCINWEPSSRPYLQ